MADLSKVQNRVTRQDRPTRNRDSIIPNRRNTDAPQRRVFADVRNGARGNGGAEELMQALGLVTKAAGSFQDYANQKHQKQEEELGAQGLLDEANGNADPELIRKSLAYRGSVMTQRAQTAFYQNAEKLDDEVKAIINSDDPKLLDPAIRSQAIEQAINQNFKEFALDPETGKFRDWGSPVAAKWLGQQLGAARAEVRAKALQQVEEKANQNSIDQASAAFRASIEAGKPMGFEDAMGGLLPTADRRKAKETLILVAKDSAAALAERASELDLTDPAQARELRVQALQLIDNIRGSKREQQAAPQVIGETPAGEPVVAASAPAKLDPKTFFQEFIAVHEGSALVTDSNGAKVKFGINAAFNPGVDVSKLTLSSATAHFENNQWKRSGADKLPPALAAVHADTFFLNEKKAAAILKQSGGNVAKYIELRRNFLNGLAASNPAKYGKYKAGWEKRTSDLEAYAAKLGGGSSGPPVGSGVLDPLSPSELASANPVGASNPLYSLSPSERADLGAFRRQLKADIDRADDEATQHRQSVNAMDYMARLHGMGAYPTPGEIQEAARRGDISVAHAVQALGVIESDENQRESSAREARAEARADRAEQRENRIETVDNFSNSILGNLVSGKYRRGAADAEAALRTLLPTIADSEIRQAVFSNVMQGIKAHQDLRNATPEIRRAMGTLDEWEAVYVSQLTKGRRVPPEYRGRADVMVKNWINERRVRLSQWADVSPDKVQGFMDLAEKELDARIDRYFPPRGSPTASGTQVRGAGR